MRLQALMSTAGVPGMLFGSSLLHATRTLSDFLQLSSHCSPTGPLHVRNSSQLAYEEIIAGSPTPDHPTASPGRTVLILHGLLGCGRNWRTWARKLAEGAVASYPAQGGPWRVVLVDLRCHGSSARRPGLHPPHTMWSAAEDVSRLIGDLVGSHPPGAVLGHSMGGKVALALLQMSAKAAGTQPQAGGTGAAGGGPEEVPGTAPGGGRWCAPPRQLWVLDSQPGWVTSEQDAGTGVARVLDTVHSVPLPIPSRAWLLTALRDRGLSEALATWLASNLTPWPQGQQQSAHSKDHPGHQHPHHQGPGGRQAGSPLTWTFDIQGAAAMYMSYRTTDLWPTLEHCPPGTAVHLVQGDRSDRWPPDLQQRLMAAVAAAAARREAAGTAATAEGGKTGVTAAAGHEPSTRGSGGGGCFHHHVLERAGHWLHVDNPEGLLRVVLPRLTER